MHVRKAAGSLGAFVEGVSLEEAGRSEVLFAEVHAALLEHQVLFFRDQRMSPVEYQRFARRFGSIEGHPAYNVVRDAPDVQILESTPEHPSKIELWHTDMTFRPEPPAITLLHGQIIPPFGGDTLWASATTAYDALSEPVRQSWQPQTVAIWDNRCTQHKPVNYFLSMHRKMHRVTIAGDRPI